VIVRIFEDKKSLSRAAADQASAAVRRAILDHGCARIIVATGASQLDFLGALTNAENIDWQRVEMFHLDEYVGLPITHPASFRKYLLERLIHKVRIAKYHLLDGSGDPGQDVSSPGRRHPRIAVRADRRGAFGIGDHGVHATRFGPGAHDGDGLRMTPLGE